MMRQYDSFYLFHPDDHYETAIDDLRFSIWKLRHIEEEEEEEREEAEDYGVYRFKNDN